MTNTMTYRDDSARIAYDDEDGVMTGQVASIRDGVGEISQPSLEYALQHFTNLIINVMLIKKLFQHSKQYRS